MRVRLEDRFVKKLLNLPESGMGYQRVDVRLRDGRELSDLVVYNAEEIELPASVADVGLVDVRIHER
jgi:hypothetical protein